MQIGNLPTSLNAQVMHRLAPNTNVRTCRDSPRISTCQYGANNYSLAIIVNRTEVKRESKSTKHYTTSESGGNCHVWITGKHGLVLSLWWLEWTTELDKTS